MEESRNVVEEVQAIEKTAKNLSVITVNPFAAGLDGVFAVRERNVVAHDGAPEDFIDRWFQEEGLAKPESKSRGANIRVRHTRWISRVAGPVLSRIGEMRFVQHVIGDGIEPVSVDDLDLRRTLDAVRGCSIGRHIKRLVGIFRIIVVVGPENLVPGIQVVVDTPEASTVANCMVHRQAVILIEVALHKIQQHLALTIRVGRNLCVSDVGIKYRA